MTLLRAQALTVRFGGIPALDGCSLDVVEGELVGLVGPNGAGKTTLFDCLTGRRRPNAGRVLLAGRDITTAPPHRRARLGVARTFQRIEPFAGMTPREHLLVAARARRVSGGLWRDLTGRSAPTPDESDHTEQTLAILGLEEDADRPIEMLGLGRGRLVELGRALMTRPRLLLLDEPSSGLDTHEIHEVERVVEALPRVQGMAVVLVEHDLDLVRRVARRLVCLDLGTVIAKGPVADVLNDPAVRRAYVGEAAP